MTRLAETSLSDDERALIERYVEEPRMTAPAWAPGPARPELAAGAVHVWRADLASTDSALESLLSDEERERAQQMLRDENRRLWARSRGTLRSLLGRYLQRDPRQLSFTTGPHGKPELADRALSFNLSHSGDVALYAVRAVGEVGVDVQLDRRSVDEAAIAGRFLATDDVRRLARLPPAQRRTEFLRAWVRHEAALKCRGTGFGGGGETSAPNTEGGAGGLWLADLDVGPGTAAAVAGEVTPRELCCWEW
jgi:4'-phosphopantetheinyl transferase